ncbi:MAG: hypothetical protein ED555_00625 [Allomuricauda sp.]|nr:MAG: hypothetical protein ED555_00625 [Allomuricauda sp.]
MRITSFCAILALLFITQATAQVKIGDNPQSIDGSSILELESNSRVFVVTRVNTAQMNAITPLRGALLYNTDEGCVFYYNGASWVNLCSEQNTTNVSLSLVDDDLVLTDSDGNSVSVTLEGVGVQTFTSDPVVNGQATIVITQTGDNFNFEVSQITGDNIVDGSINGFLDIQFNSISADQLAPNSVGQEELQDNTVGDLEIDYGQVTVSDFSNDAGYLTAANLVSTDVPNSLTTGTDGGVLYDDSALQTSINDHIANDGDLDDQNELITSAVLDGSNNLVINQPGGNITVPLNSLNNAGSDDQQLSLAGNILTLEDGGTVDLSGFAGTGTDDQQLSLAGNILTLEDGGTVDLSGFAGTGTDDQTLTLLGNEITIEDGNTIDLTPILGGGADGVVTNVQLNGSDLEFTGTAPGFNGTVDLSSLAGGGADGVVTDVQLNGTDLEFTGTAPGFNATVDLSSLADDQNAAEVPFTPYLSLGAIDTQAAIEELKDEVDAIVVGGGGNPIDELQDLQLTGDILTVTNPATPGNQVDLSPYLDNQNAAEVPYDNTTSGLTATDTQAAIDEIAASVIVDTDDQTVDEFQIVADQLSISLQDDGVAPSTVDLSPYLDNTDNQTADLVPYDNTASGLTATDTQAAIDEIAGSAIVDTDDQTVDEFQIVADQLSISLQDDGAAPSTVDLSPYLDNTDNQTADLVPYDNTTSGLTATDTQAAIDEIAASGIVDTDDQTVDEFQIVADQLSISLQDDGAAPSTVDLSPYLDNTDNQTADLVPYDNTTSGLTATDTQAAIDEIAGASGSQNLFDAVDVLTANITHDLGGFDFVLGGSGNVGIGSLPGAPASQLDVNGQIRGRSGIAAGGGSVNLPDYAFHTGDDMDTGMYRPGPDQIGFSTGGTNALTIDAAQEVTIAQNLDLDGDVLDFNDVTGTVGQVLSSRGAGNGVEWINAAAIAPAIQYSIPFYNAAGNDLQEAIHPTKSTQSFYWDQSARFNTGALFIGVDDGAQNTDAKVQIVEDLPTALAYPLVIQNRTNVDTGGGAVGLLFSAERAGSFGKGALVYERNASFGRGDFHFLQEPNGDGNDPDLGDAALTIKNDGNVGIGTSNPTANLHTAGSFAANIRSDAALNVVIGDNDYTVIVDSATDIDLPAANSAQGRIYIIKNVTGVAITMSADSFVPSTSTTPTSTLQIGVTQLQSDGTNWQQIN